MKPQLLKVPLTLECSFSVRQDVVSYFYNRWHYHPEVEILHIEQGNGTQFVGDSIQNFQAGDVLLIGPNLPHYWRCDSAYFDNRKDLFAKATVVHFQENFWGDGFLHLPENRHMAEFLGRAKQGMRLQGQTRQEAKVILSRMLAESGTTRIISLIQLIEFLARSTEIELLSTVDYPNHFDETDTDRINQIYAYSIANFQRKIMLNEIAAVANMSPNSFCRYFKSRSRKSYSQFIQELRVRHACKLLIQGQLSVGQVCFESGFNQFSSFNKYFKLITGKSPMRYQKAFGKGN